MCVNLMAAAPAGADRPSVLTRKSRCVVSLLIDNYDSYTYNIMQMLAQVNGFSSSVMVIKNDDFRGHFTTAWDHFVAQTNALATALDVEVMRNIVISPGPGHPAEPKDFGMCTDAIRYSTVPVLGVCLGHQGLAHVYGGQVIQAKHVMHGRTSRVFIEEKAPSLFAHVPNGLEVVRYHSLVVDPSNVPKELEICAQTEDGVIMALRHRTKQQFGVQFHPEAVCTEFGYQLFQNFRDLTLDQCTSKCELHHSIYPEKNDIMTAQDVEKTKQQPPSYRVLIQRALSGLASLKFAEFVFVELFGTSKRSFWLDSSNHDIVATTEAANQSRCSMMGDNSGPLSYCVEYDVAKGELRLHRRQFNTDEEQVERFSDVNILTHIRDVLRKHGHHSVVYQDSEGEQEMKAPDVPFAFRGGFVGYFGYEVLGSELEGSKEKEAKENEEVQTERAPDASLLFADRTLVFDHRDGVIYSLSVCENEANGQTQSLDWHAAMKARLAQLSEAFRQNSSMIFSKPVTNGYVGTEKVVFRPSRMRAQYMANIKKIQRLIREGETYEVCLTNHLRAELALYDPLAFYRLLRQRNPAPFAGFYLSNPRNAFQAPSVQLHSYETYALCCSSPERLLQVGADGWMESKPIKGTRRRGHDPNEDASIAEELVKCEKDRAENMMIADLVRNDFGVVARVGSVHVPKLMNVETYTTVHQLVTTVRAQKKEDADVIDVLQATFPGGSMTGAPKKRTMQIIRDLEQAPRGVYSGGLGFLSLDGSCDLNIIIRSAIVTPNRVTLGAGGAIVALSEKDKEYDEMLLKAQALVDAIGAFVTGEESGLGAQVLVD